jgi:hypothetical protein
LIGQLDRKHFDRVIAQRRLIVQGLVKRPRSYFDLLMPLPSPTILNPHLFFSLFGLMWFSIGGLLSYLSGWRSLAGRFRATQPADGERFRFVSGSVGASTLLPVSYHSCLFFNVGNNGFLVSVFFPFRFLTPPLFIPWAQVDSVKEQRLWFRRHAVVRIRGFSTKIIVPGRAGQCIINVYAQISSQHER